jgi:hypothetical protein
MSAGTPFLKFVTSASRLADFAIISTQHFPTLVPSVVIINKQIGKEITENQRKIKVINYLRNHECF